MSLTVFCHFYFVQNYLALEGMQNLDFGTAVGQARRSMESAVASSVMRCPPTA
jgi:hypothetical protein